MIKRKEDKFSIWITLDCENPDLEDIAKAQCELENLGIDYVGKVGIGFTACQWSNFISNLSRFEMRFAHAIPAKVMGFPIRLIKEFY